MTVSTPSAANYFTAPYSRAGDSHSRPQDLKPSMSARLHEFLRLSLIAIFGYLACSLPDSFTAMILLSVAARPQSYLKAYRLGGQTIIVGCFMLATLLVLDALTRELPPFSHPGERAMDTARWLLLLLGFVPLADGLAGKPSRIAVLLGAALAGFFTGLFKTTPLKSILLFQNDLQTGFHLTAPTTGLIAATAILGLLIFGPFILEKGARNPLWQGVKFALWGVALYLCTFMLMASQSRASYLVSVIVIPLTLWIQDQKRPPQEGSWQLKKGLQFAAALLILQGLVINHEAIWHRIEPDVSSLKEIVSSAAPLQSPRIVESSLNLRWAVLQEAFRVIKEKPFFGWGPLSSRSLIASSGDERLMTPITHLWLAHFHNGYAEIIVRSGLIGFMIILIGLKLMGHSLIRAIQQRSPPRDWVMFCLSSLTMILIWGFSSNFNSDPIRGLITLISSTSFSLAIYSKPRQLNPALHIERTP
ncbi:MAG: O-antigen ligase domain-containing protein [Gammaproteobacteria bacterium]|nr:O-antigen ligase domain-containing protein [Gammaproteobacteria bacterium]